MTTMDSSPPNGAVRRQGHGHPPSGAIFSAEDRQLLQDCLQGRPAAWDAFVARFGGLLAFVVDRTADQRRMSLTPADRDDLLADILLEILHHDAAVLRSFEGRSSLATYLAVVARRVAVRCLTKLSEKTRGRRPLTDGHATASGDDAPTRLAIREQVETMIGVLSESEGRLVRLYYLEERSYSEISHITGMPLGSIGPALKQLREKMRLQSE